MLAALRANGNTTTKLVSLDLDEPLALDMAKGGNTFALIADKRVRDRPGDGEVGGVRAARQARRRRSSSCRR